MIVAFAILYFFAVVAAYVLLRVVAEAGDEE